MVAIFIIGVTLFGICLVLTFSYSNVNIEKKMKYLKEIYRCRFAVTKCANMLFSFSGLRSNSVLNNVCLFNNGIYLRSLTTTQHYRVPSEGLLDKIKKRIGLGRTSKALLKSKGFDLYEKITDQINYTTFFKDLDLPDTFYSWFLVTELHIWMLMARLMNEGEDGRFVRNALVEAMWQDVEAKAKQLGESPASIRRKQINELADSFHASLFSYDEGILSSDIVLAGALWRKLLQQKEFDPKQLEALIQYVRHQMSLLDDMNPEELIHKQSFKLIEFQV